MTGFCWWLALLVGLLVETLFVYENCLRKSEAHTQSYLDKSFELKNWIFCESRGKVVWQCLSLCNSVHCFKRDHACNVIELPTVFQKGFTRYSQV